MKPLNIIVLLFILSLVPVAHADFGNWFVANKRLSTSLDTSNKKISFRFTCQEDMDLSAVAIFCSEALGSPGYRVSFQDNIDGLPSGTPLAFSTYIPLAQTWSTLPLTSAPLIKGKVYHVVIEHDINRGGGHPVGKIGPSHFASFLSTDVLNHLHPNDGSPDLEANVLFFDGQHWKELNQEPVYAVYGVGSRFQGNPYDKPGIRPVYGSGNPNDKSSQVLQGESLHFHCGFPAKSFAIRIRKEGTPQSPLNYLLLKNQFEIHKALQIHKSLALTPNQVSSSFQWVTIGFDDKGASNFSDECWFFALQTDSGHASQNYPGCEDCYILSDVRNSGGLGKAAELTFDGGAHLSRAVYSTDGGDPFHWLDDFESDSNIGAIGPPCPPQTAIEYQPIPTPQPLEGVGDFNP